MRGRGSFPDRRNHRKVSLRGKGRSPLALFLLLGLLAAQTSGAETGVVEEVVDGDTMRVRTAGSTEAVTVRLIGIDAPERSHPSLGKEYLSDEAATVLSSLCRGKTVRMEKDAEDTDRYDRLLRYVFLPPPDGRLLNGEMLRAGMARAYTRFPFFEEKRVRLAGGRGAAGGEGATEQQGARPSPVGSSPGRPSRGGLPRRGKDLRRRLQGLGEKRPGTGRSPEGDRLGPADAGRTVGPGIRAEGAGARIPPGRPVERERGGIRIHRRTLPFHCPTFPRGESRFVGEGRSPRRRGDRRRRDDRPSPPRPTRCSTSTSIRTGSGISPSSS